MHKVITTIAVFVTLTTAAAADPLSDFFGGVFGGQKRPQPGAGVEQAMRFSGIRKSLAGKKPGGPI